MKTRVLKLKDVRMRRYYSLVCYLAHGLYLPRQRWFNMPSQIRVYMLGEAYEKGCKFFKTN